MGEFFPDALIIHEYSPFVQRRRAKTLKQFDIVLHSFKDVQEFVELATVQPYRIVVGNDRTRVSAKSYMGMFSLDYSLPVQVRLDCTEEECDRFKAKAARFLA